jgi:hypothetical protein
MTGDTILADKRARFSLFHAGVMLLNRHGAGSSARRSSGENQPMPKPSPFKLPKPRCIGNDGSCRRSRASYDCLMMERSGHKTASATSIGWPM